MYETSSDRIGLTSALHYTRLMLASFAPTQVQIYANEETGKPDRPPLAQIDWHLKNVSTDDPETQPVYMLSVMPMGKTSFHASTS